MGVNHLEELRTFLKKNKGKRFSRTDLRNELNHNYNTVLQNLKYLIEIEKVVITFFVEEKSFYQWKS